MLSLLINIFIIIGVIVSILGSCFLGLFGFMILYELLDENVKDFKLQLLERDFKMEKKLFIKEHLDDLKERYPDLEIKYKFK